MTDQHRATPEQWEELKAVSQSILKMHAPHSCILELRARVEALEAAAISAPENPDTSSDRPAPADSLVEKVADAIYRNGTGDGFRDEARAVIREVAAWMRDNGHVIFTAKELEQEANS